MVERLRELERRIDELEYRAVLMLLTRQHRINYWKRTRPIRRGSLGEPTVTLSAKT